jgi:SUMO ligase MMS21 Smc5/6 complex component
VEKLSYSDQDLFMVMLNYLEAKQDTDSIVKAFDLYIEKRCYKRAMDLYNKSCTVKLKLIKYVFWRNILI